MSVMLDVLMPFRVVEMVETWQARDGSDGEDVVMLVDADGEALCVVLSSPLRARRLAVASQLVRFDWVVLPWYVCSVVQLRGRERRGCRMLACETSERRGGFAFGGPEWRGEAACESCLV
jgi:hypothetical protein